MTGIVLIGGRSKRFGKDKVLEHIGSKLLLEHVIDTIGPLFEHIILIGHPRKDLSSYHIIEDIIPERGPLGGILTALHTTPTQYCFVFAADMPNLNPEFIRYMISCAGKHDIIVPVWSKGREPLHAIYHSRIKSIVRSLLDQNIYRIYDLFQQTSVLKIPEEKISEFGSPRQMFANINTPDDAQSFQKYGRHN